MKEHTLLDAKCLEERSVCFLSEIIILHVTSQNSKTSEAEMSAQTGI